jgi:ribosomal protein S27AE
MLTGLWQLVKSSDVERLSDFVVWNSDYVAVQIPHVAGRLRPDLITLYETDLRRMLSELADPGDGMEQSVLAHKDRDPHGLRRRWTTDDPIEPVRYYVIREVNKALQGKVNRTVLPYWDGNVYYVPASLLAAVYVAFQDEIIKGVRTERACARCGSVFTVRRKDKIYCSDNCAKRASDARRRALRETSNGQKS